ncbi:MAG TPA: FtsQ-type POTRA domain-containing protein [Candidatus Baltobacteraceae bacterium]|nr:FtsQ-type POTRA domain-containing protein [Candidatus Baltobacteraceae bacterium]
MKRRPQRKKRSAAARLRPFWFLLLVVAALAVAGGYYGATWSGFQPKGVKVSGNKTVSTAEILSRAQISLHDNVWLQNMRAASARVRAIPYIADVWIHRAPPANVSIVVTERKPAAIVESNGAAVLVDDTLRVLQPAQANEALPVVVSNAPAPAPGATFRDEATRKLFADQTLLAAQHVIVRRVQFDKYDDLVADMSGGVKLLLGDDSDLAEKSRMVAPILSQVAAKGRRIDAIDLRAPKTPVVRFR